MERGGEMRGEKGGMRRGWVYRFAGGGHWHRLSLSLNSFRFRSGTLPRSMGTALQI
jgi:hypothetical protein